MGPGPVPAPWGILLKIHTVHCLVIMIISWKFEMNPLRIDKDMTWRWSWKRKKKKIIITRLDQSNVLDWKVFSILLKTKFIVSHVMLKYRCRSSIWFCLCRFELNPTVNNGYMSIEKYYSVIPMQPEVPFSTTTVENLKWFGQELTEFWIDKSNNKERICIYLAIDPKGQRDLQCHMMFDMTSMSYGLPRSLWTNCDSIQR